VFELLTFLDAYQVLRAAGLATKRRRFTSVRIFASKKVALLLLSGVAIVVWSFFVILKNGVGLFCPDSVAG
jgi:hypothetical protein